MRLKATSKSGKLQVAAFAGTRAILIALNMSDSDRKGLLGFAFKRSIENGPGQWLKGMKTFPSLAPVQPTGHATHFPTNESPVQSFLWSDYEAQPATKYSFEVTAMYGKPGELEPREAVTFEVQTEAADDGQHGIWFNRGAIASQAFADQFGNKSLTDEDYNDPANKEVAWLSRGLLEACLEYIRKTPSGDGLRVCAYEFTYERVHEELIAALKRGVDVQIIYHATSANKKAIKTSGLPTRRGSKRILFERTRPKTPHNKFIVRLEKNKTAIAVWTGSTNFTPSGFLGQTNVGHLVTEKTVAATYLKLWTELSTNPESKEQHAKSFGLSPNPKNVIDKGITLVFSPRPSDRMLNWYGARAGDAATSAMFTGAFTVDPDILGPMAKQGPAMRFILMERPPTHEVIQAQANNPADLMFSYGAILGKMQLQQAVGHDEDGKNTKKWVPIPHSKIEEWFLTEELERKNGQGFVFFIHTKFLLVDPLSNDPLVFTGSANFSGESLKSNDENMLLIRGNTRVADIYLTEFDRIFRHFYSRDAANNIAKHGGQTKFGLLDDTDRWTNDYFDKTNAKNHRREMFFADPKRSWQADAAKDPDVFVGEGVRGGKGTKGAKDGGEPVARAAARKTAAPKKKGSKAGKKAAAKKKAQKKARKAAPKKVRQKRHRG
ncbi:phosphatidylserine/phosphatidylglycerophosphate/cardiolipin synthase-like enzyme [Bradyrhizobium sp. LA6.1]|uniref:phospholipase D-like domain-containing protein n=1 Tax=Bradyrhizobium sp. LA6.1 TaxID=3156378 RepID=UPI003395B81B